MKKIFIVILLVFTSRVASSQTIFFKGEWSMTDKKDLFTCFCKLNILPAAGATVEFIWTYLATDSNNLELVNYYKGKKGKIGIEYTAGTYTVSTQDIFLSTTELADPQEILGKGKYFLKISLDKQVIYGRTTSMEGTDPGLFYAIKANMSSAEFEKLKEQAK